MSHYANILQINTKIAKTNIISIFMCVKGFSKKITVHKYFDYITIQFYVDRSYHLN